MRIQRCNDGYWVYFTGYAYYIRGPKTLFHTLIYGYPQGSSYKTDYYFYKNEIPKLDECLAYTNDKDELIIKDIDWFNRLLIDTLPKLITVEEFAADNKKSPESIKKYLQQGRIRGAQLLKSPSAKKGIWVIPKHADISETPFKKVTKKEKYKPLKNKTESKKINNKKIHKIPVEIHKIPVEIPSGYNTIYDYANMQKKTVQQVLNQIQNNKIKAYHIPFNTGGKRGVWVVKDGCPWPLDGRKKYKNLESRND